MWAPPDKTALPSAQVIYIAKKEINILEIELRVAVEALEEAQLRVDALTKRLGEGKAWIAPIRKLPVELLSEIFVANSKDEERGPTKIAAVCRLWRSIILAIPHAWCPIWMENDLSPKACHQYVSTFFKRSNPVLLHMKIPEDYFDYTEEFSTRPILFSNSHRIRCLSIYSHQAIDVMSLSFPNVTDLAILPGEEEFEPSCTVHITIAFSQLETLEAASIIWEPVSEPIPFRMHLLKRLSILMDDVGTWLDIVQCCSKTLESLSVWTTDPGYGTPRNRILDFPVLKFLEFGEHFNELDWPIRAGTPALVSYMDMREHLLTASPAGQPHHDVESVIHLRTGRVPVLLKYNSLRVLGLTSTSTLALLLFEQLQENINICPLLETIELVLGSWSLKGDELRFVVEDDNFPFVKRQLEEENRKTNRSIQLIFTQKWTVEMAFDPYVTMCKPCEPCGDGRKEYF